MPSLQRFAFFALALLALVVQTFIVQTHIHRQMPVNPSTPLLAVAADVAPVAAALDQKSIPADQFPGSGDPNDCQLCQGFAHSGQFVHGGAVLAYIPAWVSVQFIVLSDAVPALLAISHSWQGRAPPQI